MANRSRVVIIVFDALRPDMVKAKSMPHLHAFANQGVLFTNSRSTFPTETRVNQSAVVTGCYPQRHGITGNQFFDAVASPERILNSGDEDQLRAADKALNGSLLGAESLGELLYRQGCSLATISAGTPGGARLLHHCAEKTDGFRLSLARPDAYVGDVPFEELTRKFGDIPPSQMPSISWLQWSTDVFIEHVLKTLKPDVSILWLCEPDNSYHKFGVGSSQSLQAVAAADAQFARVIDACEDERDLQIFTLSDHGQLAALHEPVGVSQSLTDAGFTVSSAPQDDSLALSVDTAGGIYLSASGQHQLNDVVAVLQAQDWCGLLFTRQGVGGTLRHEDLFVDHVRAPDVGLVIKANEQLGPYGLPGTTAHDSKYLDGGVHGGLNPYELHNWFAARGSRLAEQRTIDAPVGLIDVLPTTMRLLDLPVPPHVQGRVLSTAFRSNIGTPEKASGESVSDDNIQVTVPRPAQLKRRRVGQSIYIDGLFAEN